MWYVGSVMMRINISIAYENDIIFKDFVLDIIDNKINVIVGPSGCGKTTLLKCIAGICDYKGEILPQINSIGYVFQEDRLFPYLSVIKNLQIIDKDLDKIISYLKKFQLYDVKDKYPHQLSGGEKQRIAIIRAFLRNNDLILMDEPFNSLDYFLRQSLMEMIYQIYESTKKTIILVTHDLDIALYLGHFIHVFSDKITVVRESIENPYVLQSLNENSVLLLNKIKVYLDKKS